MLKIDISIILNSEDLSNILKTYYNIDSFYTKIAVVSQEYIEKHFDYCQKELKITDKLYELTKIYGYKDNKKAIKLNANNLKKAVVLYFSQIYNLNISHEDIVLYLSFEKFPGSADRLYINEGSHFNGNLAAKINRSKSIAIK